MTIRNLTIRQPRVRPKARLRHSRRRCSGSADPPDDLQTTSLLETIALIRINGQVPMVVWVHLMMLKMILLFGVVCLPLPRGLRHQRLVLFQARGRRPARVLPFALLLGGRRGRRDPRGLDRMGRKDPISWRNMESGGDVKTPMSQRAGLPSHPRAKL